MMQKYIEYIKKYYDIDVINVNLAASQYSDVYKIDTLHGVFALIQYNQYKDISELRNELILYDFLNKTFEKRVCFQIPIDLKTDLEYYKLNGRYSILFEWVFFKKYRWTDEQKENMFEFYFELNQKLKLATRTLNINFPISGVMKKCLDKKNPNFVELNFDDYVNSLMSEKLNKNMIHINKSIEFVYEYYKQNAIEINQIEMTIIHNDLSPQNVGFDNQNNISFIMDFDLCKIGAWQYDFSWLLWAFLYNQESINYTKFDKELNKYLKQCNSVGLKINFQMFFFMLLTRFLLTLNGRLKNEKKGLPNSLNFVEDKIDYINFIINNYSKYLTI